MNNFIHLAIIIMCGLLGRTDYVATVEAYTVTLPQEAAGGKLPAEAVWQGGATFVIEHGFHASGPGKDYTVLGANAFGPDPADTNPHGWTAQHAALILSNAAILSADQQEVSLELKACPGFVLQTDVTMKISQSDMQTYLAGGSAADFFFTIAKSSIPGYALWTVQGGNEDDVRRMGLTVTVTLQFNRFLPGQIAKVKPTSSGVYLGTTGTSDNWNRALSQEDTVLTMSLPALNTYDISQDVELEMSFDTAIVTYVGSTVGVAGTVSPFNTSKMIEAVNGKPLVFCEFYPSSVTERDMRQGQLTFYIRLTPENKDAFTLSNVTTMGNVLQTAGGITGQAATIWSLATAGPDSSTIWAPSQFSVNLTHVTISMSPPLDYNIDQQAKIQVNPVPGLLASEEAGCNNFILPVLPAAADVVGGNIPSNVSETDVNDGAHVFNFSVTYDKFQLDAKAGATVELVPMAIPSGDQRDDLTSADHYSFSNVVPEMTVQVAPSQQWCLVTIPRSERLNIPYLYAEKVTIVFDSAAMASGVKPYMIDSTFEIQYVPPTVNATFFDDLTQYQIHYYLLWIQPVNVTLTLRGDIWDSSRRPVWSHRRPKFAAPEQQRLENKDSSFNSFYDPVAGTNNMDYGLQNANIEFKNGNRTAVLPMKKYVGLAVSVNEHVDISEMAYLIRGRTGGDQGKEMVTFFTIRSDEGPSKILPKVFGEVTGIGVPSGITETQARAGFWFAIETKFTVLQQGYITNNLAKMFPSESPLNKFIPDASVTFPNTYTLNVTFPPIEAFDVDVTQIINVYLPNEYYGLAPKLIPTVPCGASLTIRANPSPKCEVSLQQHLSEEGVRQGQAEMHITVADDFWKDDAQSQATLPGSLNSTFNSTMPLAFAGVYISTFSGSTILVVQFVKNETYNIDQSDDVLLTLNRLWFRGSEACRPINFTVAVKPGVAKLFLPPVVNETMVATQEWSFNISVQGERLIGSQFPVTVEYTSENLNPTTAVPAGVTPSPGSMNTEFRGLVNSQPNQQLLAVADPNNATIFIVTVKPYASYDIAQTETVTLFVPTTIVASGKLPFISDNVLVISPVPSKLEMSGPAGNVLMENDVVQRSEKLYFTLGADAFVTSALKIIADACVYKDPDALSPSVGCRAMGLLPLESYTLSADKKQLIVEFPDNLVTQEFDATVNSTLEFTFSQAVTLSGLEPEPRTLAAVVMPGVPTLNATGTALMAGSQDLALGGLTLTLYLANGLFSSDRMIPPVLCTVGIVGCNPQPNNKRNVTITYLKSEEALFSFNRTYNLSLPRDAIVSNELVENITIQVYIQPGVVIARLAARQGAAVSSVVTEDQVRNGETSGLLFELWGDRFDPLTTSLTEALAAGVVCWTGPQGSRVRSTQVGGFCGRRNHIFVALTTSITYSAENRIATIMLQPDADFDVAVEEHVQFYVGFQATESGLAPIPHPNVLLQPLEITVTPTQGKVYYSATTATLTEAQMSGATPSVNGDPLATFNFALTGERWITSPTASLVSGFSSSLAIKVEANGFEKHKASFFNPAVVSDGGRLLTITMKPTAAYSIRQFSEDLSFNVFGSCVQSGLNPQLQSLDNKIVVSRDGGVLSFATNQRTTFSMEETRDYGFTVAIQSEQLWATELVITPDALRAQLSSSASPALEANGFMAFIDTMAPVKASPIGQTLSFTIRPDKRYRISTAETLTLKVPPSWDPANSEKFPFVPDHLSVIITPAQRTIHLYILKPVNQPELIEKLALFVGVTTDMITIYAEEVYGTGARAQFSRLRIGFLSSNATGSRTPEEAGNFLVQTSDPAVLKARTNVSAAFYVDANAPLDSIDTQIGIKVVRTASNESESVVWIYLSISLLVLFALVFVIYYQCWYKHSMYSGMNRPQKDVNREKKKRKKDLDEDSDDQDQEMYSSGLDGALLGEVPQSGSPSLHGTAVSPAQLKTRPGRLQPTFSQSKKGKGRSPQGDGGDVFQGYSEFDQDLDEYHDDDEELPNLRGNAVDRSAVALQELEDSKWSGKKKKNTPAPVIRGTVGGSNALAHETGGHLLVDDLHAGQPSKDATSFLPPPARANPNLWMKEERELDSALDDIVNREEKTLQSVYPVGTPSAAKFGTNRITKQPVRKGAIHRDEELLNMI